MYCKIILDNYIQKGRDSMKNGSKYIILGVTAILCIVLSAGVFWFSSIVQTADNIKLETALLDQTTFIYATDPESGKEFVYDSIYDDENRIWIEYDKIPKDMVNAFVAIEDQRFFSHHGFDVKRLIGAMTTFVSKGNSSYGASTITQQLVKNISGDEDVNVKRKLREIYRAVKIEQQYSKEEIMEFYLNTIYLSNQCNGVEAAAQRYFGKGVNELSLAQMASIAGITQFPTKYDPLANPKENKKKQETVLQKMLELSFITSDEYIKAKNEKLDFSKGKTNTDIPQAKRYFSDAVIMDVLEDLQSKGGYPKQIALKMLYSGGLKIYCSVNPQVQDIVEKVYSDEDNFPKYGDDIMQSAIVILDPKTGNIVGMSGGHGDEGRMTLNRATQTYRQPGSSIKPIAVYGPALEAGVITENSYIVDEPIKIDSWQPKNSGGGFSGGVTLRRAIASSINIPAIKVLQNLGVEKSYEFLTEKLHISSLIEEKEDADGNIVSDKALAPLSLGGLTYGVTVKEMAAAYAPFANGGLYFAPSTYYKVCDFNGNVILDNTQNEGEIVYSEDNAYLMTELLQGVTAYGTGTAANLGEMPSAGKTGTADDNKDKWFVGYTPYYLAAVWTGYDIPRPIYSYGNPSANMWRKVMSEVHENLEVKRFEKPDPETKRIKVCTLSGKIAGEGCAVDIRGISCTEYRSRKDIASDEKCDVHKIYNLCSETGLLARGDCPKQKVGAFGYADDEHAVQDGYIEKEYCTKWHYRAPQQVSVCEDSGLLAGDNCKNVKKVDKNDAPEGECQLVHGEDVTEGEAENPEGTVVEGEVSGETSEVQSGTGEGEGEGVQESAPPAPSGEDTAPAAE